VAGQPPVGAGRLPRFALFAAPGEATSRLLAEYSDLLEPTPRPPCGDGGAWLVRPDGYVAAVARAGDLSALSSYLRSLR
jgi:hypothetical protein